MLNNINIKLKKGFISIETIVALSVVLIFMLLFIAILTYHYPRIMLEKEVQTLAQIAKIQGGLTDSSSAIESDVDVFKDRLEKIGYNRDKIEITAQTIPGRFNAIGVTPLNGTGNNYIKRNTKELIEIVVKVPASKYIIFFKMKNTYVIREIVGSERW